jgi:hypothetical protein
MNKLQYFIFWLKWKDKLNSAMFKDGMSTDIYSIAPNSFKISWNNYIKLKELGEKK